MSSVLRPNSFIKRSTEGECKEIEQSVPVDIPASTLPETEHIVDVHTPTETIEEQLPAPEPSPTLVNEEVAKEEKISAVLQEILERKIDKAITNAEASLETTPLTNQVTQEGVDVKSQPSPISTTVSNQVQNIPIEIVKTPGQEIHIPVQVTVPSPVAAAVAPLTEPFPVVSNINVIPVNVTQSEVLPVVTNIEQTTLPVANPVNSLPVQQSSAPAQLIAPEQKIHWFDRLFGSTPKTPPQSV